jgi:DNA-binding CsgD family transcriptional regulator
LEEAEVRLKLLKLSWGSENPAYRQVFTMSLIPGGTPEQFAWFNNLQLVSTSPSNAVEVQRMFNVVDVYEAAKTIEVPTLIIQAKHDSAVPFECGRDVAAQIPGAHFAILESRNHVLMRTEPAWSFFWDEYYGFLGVGSERSKTREEVSVEDKLWSELSARERDVLRLLAQGLSNLEISQKLVLSEKTIRNYVSNIYEKLQIHSRGEAIVLARKFDRVEGKR